MLTIEKVLLLKNARMFADAPTKSLAGVADVLREVTKADGEEIIREGDLGTSMYVVADGEVQVEVGGRAVARLGQGEVVGELSALDPEPRSATVRAIGDVRLLQLDSAVLYELMADRIEVAHGVVRFLCQRFRQATRQG
jgi:CRP-like cAMP-binding protein